MLEVGQLVRVLPPFGDGQTPHVVIVVQHVNAAGEIVAEPAEAVQYLVTPENADPADAVAFGPQWLEAVD